MSEDREGKEPLKSYRDLVVWQKAMDLVVEIYKLTKKLPREERFGLTSQMRDAVVSIPSNIAFFGYRERVVGRTGNANDRVWAAEFSHARGCDDGVAAVSRCQPPSE